VTTIAYGASRVMMTNLAFFRGAYIDHAVVVKVDIVVVVGILGVVAHHDGEELLDRGL